jgi:hypothetical protein
MYKLTFIVIIMLIAVPATAQKSKSKVSAEIKVPMTPSGWQFDEGSVEFLTYKNTPVMKISQGNKKATIRDLTFTDGIIEFDVEPILPGFAQSVYFHRKDDKEQEIVYLRVNHIGNKLANEGIQYTPYFGGVNMWDMYPQYQGPAPTLKDSWNHLKLVISGKQMKVYMNRQPRPVLWIPKLEGNLNEGSIAFEGTAYISNVVVRPNETEGLPGIEGADLTDHDANYLRVWVMSKPTDLTNGSEATISAQPSLDQFTDSIKAEREGFINLTRKFGANDSRKVIWLKTRITTKQAVKAKLQLGFSDEVWVFLNSQTVYVDKNLYLQNMRKYPNGRMSIDNATININLKEGDNDLMLAVANDFYGWGVVARLESTESVVEVDNVRDYIETAKEVANLNPEMYEGTYATPDLPIKLTFSKKDSKLLVQATGQTASELQALGKHKFEFAAEGAVFEFKPEEKKMTLRQGGRTFQFARE